MGVFVVPGDDGLSEPRQYQLQRALETALGTDQTRVVVGVDNRLSQRAGLLPQAIISESRGLLALGSGLLARNQAREALPRLQAAVIQLTRVVAYTDPQELARAQFLLGAAHAMVGQRQAAREMFVTLLTWQPNFAADPSLATKKVQVLWQKAQNTVRERPRGAIDLVSHPSGAAAYVDGAMVGYTPTSADSLLVGTHHVTVMRPGYRPVIQEVPVYKNIRRTVEVSLQRLPGAARVERAARTLAVEVLGRSSSGAADGKRVATAAAVLGKQLGIAQAMIVAVSTADPTNQYLSAAIYATATGTRLAAAAAPLGPDLDQVSTALVRTLYSEVVQRESPPPAAVTKVARPAPKRDRGARFYQRWWFWTGVAVAAIVPVLLLSSDNGSSCPNGSVCGEVLWRF